MVYRACYPAMLLYVVGFVVLGVGLQDHLSIGAVIMGWGISHVAVMVGTVAICECRSLSIFFAPLFTELLFCRCILQ